MGKRSRVSLKMEGGKIASRQSSSKKNFGKIQKGNHSMNPGIIVLKLYDVSCAQKIFTDRSNKPESTHPNYRTKATINRLKMYRSGGRAIRAQNVGARVC